MTRSDVTLCSWSSPATLAGNTGLYLCVRQTVSLHDHIICGLVQERVYIVQTPVRDTSDLKQRLIDTWASISQNVIDEAVAQWKKHLRASMRQNNITLNIC